MKFLGILVAETYFSPFSIVFYIVVFHVKPAFAQLYTGCEALRRTTIRETTVKGKDFLKKTFGFFFANSIYSILLYLVLLNILQS